MTKKNIKVDKVCGRGFTESRVQKGALVGTALNLLVSRKGGNILNS
jgi:hypothetical protein